MAVQVRSATLPVIIPAAPAILSSAEQTAHESDCDIERDVGDELKWRSDLDAGDVAISGDRLVAEMAAKRVAAVAQEYGGYYEPRMSGPGAENYVIDHGTYLYLMDAEGKFVRGLDADTPDERIAEAVRGAMAKARENASHQGSTNAMSAS